MKINTNSWHYRLLVKWDGHSCVPHNLCNYFWKVIGVGLFMLLVYVIVTCAAVSPLMAIGEAIIFNDTVTFFSHIGWAEIVVGFIVGSLWCIDRAIKYIRHKISNIPRNPNKQPNIFVEYFKAKKNKYCPTLEFIDKD